MNNVSPSPEENELSADDLAILQAFDALESWDVEKGKPDPTAEKPPHKVPVRHHATTEDLLDEMLIVFTSEAEEDIGRMRQTLNLLEQDEQISPVRFIALQRLGHKLRGTAGAVECHSMATIAEHIEMMAEQVARGMIFPLIGVSAIAQAVTALEYCQKSLLEKGIQREYLESSALIAELENLYQNLNIDLQKPISDMDQTDSQAKAAQETDEGKSVPVRLPTKLLLDSAPGISSIRVDARRFEHLVQHTEHLVERQAPLESALEELETALREFHIAQVRLQQLEPMLPTFLISEKLALQQRRQISSSLIARILNEAEQKSRPYPDWSRSRTRVLQDMGKDPHASWDELDIESYTEKDMLIRSLREAMADIMLCSSKVRIAYHHLNLTFQEYTTQVSQVRSDTLLIRLTPLSTLVPRLQRAITMSIVGQKQQVRFEVTGETVEIEQDILESLADPLLQLLRTCIADTFSAQEQNQPYRIWLHARGIGNEITIEIGFSMTVQGGAVNAIQEAIQHMNGTISLQRNTTGGVSFYLRFPRSHGAVHCLQVRVGDQHLLVAVSQVQRITDRDVEKLDMLYSMSDLLGFEAEPELNTRVYPILIMAAHLGTSRTVVGIAVDKVEDELELVVKPLKTSLQRPGISGSAIDGKGQVLLMADLPELVRWYTRFASQRALLTNILPTHKSQNLQSKILIADDSVYLRQSLQQTLQYANYTVFEARDGMEALEQLLENTPDAFLLDVEMPNLNGYDLLGIMRLYPELAKVKIIMLTSRSSDKHMQRALALGAHVYLTKPCPQEKLLGTLKTLLNR